MPPQSFKTLGTYGFVQQERLFAGQNLDEFTMSQIKPCHIEKRPNNKSRPNLRRANEARVQLEIGSKIINELNNLLFFRERRSRVGLIYPRVCGHLLRDRALELRQKLVGKVKSYQIAAADAERALERERERETMEIRGGIPWYNLFNMTLMCGSANLWIYKSARYNVVKALTFLP